MSAKVLAYDLGGTKIAVGVVNDRGQVLEEIRTPLSLDGKTAVLRQMSDLGLALLKRYPEIKRVGVGSAGPLDPNRGILLDPTNLAGPGKSWGRVPLTQTLSRNLKRPVLLENDAAAAMLAEHWKGQAKGYSNAIILTLGTGIGIGVISNGQLERSGRRLHPEGGHLIIRANDRSAPCGCGNYGCIEAYLSGKNFALRMSKLWKIPKLTGEDILNFALKKDPRALRAFGEYAELMAIALHNYAVIYAPEVVVFTGGFAAAVPFFLKDTNVLLTKLLARRRDGIDFLPELKVSSLDNQAGLIGAAWVALHRTKHNS